MRSFLAAVLTAFILFAASAAFADEQRGFKGIFIGQAGTALPATLKKSSPFWVGVHEGDYFRVTVMDDRVQMISVIYSGETFTRSAVRKAMTVSAAVAAHSVSKTPRPELALAKGKDGRIHGLIDLTNMIMFSTLSPTNPEGIVTEVSYLLASAPILQSSSASRLTDEQFAALTAEPAKPTPVAEAPVKVVEFADRYVLNSRETALAAIADQTDITIGRGKRVMALIDSAEVWLSVDENHPEAKDAFRKLRKFHGDYEHDYKVLVQLYASNKAKLRDGDVLGLSSQIDTNERIKRRMTQLSAMGFNRFAVDLE